MGEYLSRQFSFQSRQSFLSLDSIILQLTHLVLKIMLILRDEISLKSEIKGNLIQKIIPEIYPEITGLTSTSAIIAIYKMQSERIHLGNELSL